MKKIKSNTKCLLITSILVLIHLLSFGQTKLAELKDGTVNKAITQSYLIKIKDNKINVDNIHNKFTNVKQNSPKLFGQLLVKPDIVIDQKKLSKICAKFINIQQLEKLINGMKYAGLMIKVRTDIYGKTLEVGFFTDQNSILTLSQLEMIENEIILTKLVSMKPDILPLLEGSNFWQIRLTINYVDLLKIKLEMETSNQKENN
jgi:hypothetical protein